MWAAGKNGRADDFCENPFRDGGLMGALFYRVFENPFRDGGLVGAEFYRIWVLVRCRSFIFGSFETKLHS